MLKKSTLSAKAPQRQVVLPFTKSVEIAVKSIRSRFFRSLVTTISLVLAISFYAYIKTNTHIVSGLLMSDHKSIIEQLALQGFDVPEPGQVHTTSPKERWILFLSLLVCVVGIVNTQLMAVADRFREIGTMKCLGALDRFVLRLFLIEAALQGVIGAAIGALSGTGIAVIGALIKFGPFAVQSADIAQIVISMGLAIALGCGLSIIGVLYPALLAARMQPIEAMRGRD